MKSFHDLMVSRKKFFLGQKVLFYDSRLKFFLVKLPSRWLGPFIVTNTFSHGVLEVESHIQNFQSKWASA